MNLENLVAVDVDVSLIKMDNEDVIRVTKNKDIVLDDEPTFAKLVDCDFKNGVIEVKLLSRILEDAPEHARGFMGLAFRINEDNSQFESIYVRPANGRSDNQFRRNHTVQYFSFPDYKFDVLRVNNPSEYETYADIDLNEWINFKVVVADDKAQLYINDTKGASFIVNDLKHGSDLSGSIGLWVDVGTEGFFKDLKITKA